MLDHRFRVYLILKLPFKIPTRAFRLRHQGFTNSWSFSYSQLYFMLRETGGSRF